MDYNKLAELLLPNSTMTRDEVFAKFPKRNLKEGAQVTRMAPSPTGFIHLGNLYSALADERIAHLSNGVFYLRIEDTDLKRKVDGAVDIIINVMKYFGIEFDEGAGQEDKSENAYGPYYQRQRVEFYHVFAKDLIRQGLAYPCFCTEEDNTLLRQAQQEENATPGYYGKWAKCRNLSLEEIEENLKAGKPWVLRLKSPGDENKEITIEDKIMGKISFPENIHDIVILKSDGVPTYHFAHVIDDNLMGTTLVIRGNEWLSSVPTHFQLNQVLGFKQLKYAHTAHLMKMENNSKRKLSKRKDPELSLDFYRQDGYHPYTVKVYLLTLLNSNFEEWHDKNPDKDINEFPFSVKKMSQSGALFDLQKFHDICKKEFAKMSLEEVYTFLETWVREYDSQHYDLYFGDREYMEKVLTLCMGLNQKRRRKDFAYAKQIMGSLSYFFKETFVPNNEYAYDGDTVKAILTKYLETYDENDDNSAWFNKVKALSEELGFTTDMKAYKMEPEKYIGSVAQVSEVIRIAITGLSNTPDLCTICQIIGKEDMQERIEKAIEEL
ncbi:MAG: glutamate--tRNA ligase [Ruminococcus sp.]|nr:glutamate--tRNA ligase [Ruminococcus sp.]